MLDGSILPGPSRFIHLLAYEQNVILPTVAWSMTWALDSPPGTPARSVEIRGGDLVARSQEARRRASYAAWAYNVEFEEESRLGNAMHVSRLASTDERPPLPTPPEISPIGQGYPHGPRRLR
ncbi:hypothetical protein D3C72_359140 [compost metagenome]